jgi:hypothetical protein
LVFGLGCDSGEKSRVDPPGELQAGVASARMVAPVGIPTVGYNGVGVSGPDSPFAKMFPATNRIHGHPELKAVVLSRGPDWEVIMLRGDLIGVYQQIRRAIALEVERRLGRPVDHALVFAGTHTHSGPGRIVAGGGAFDIIADSFFPEYYERLVDNAATVIMDAYADLAPARLGHTKVESSLGHDDRRCEDGRDHTNDALPVVAVEREGRIDAVLFSYAVHGTVIGREDYTLSQDVSGAIEQHVEEGFDHPVTVMFLNSWAGDMSPATPDVELQPGAAQPDGYEKINKVGRVVADDVHAALSHLVWEDEPEIFSEVHRVEINREAIGYEGVEFPYEWGALFCGGMGDNSDCDPSTIVDGLDHNCFEFVEDDGLPQQTEISAGRLGEIAFVTLPGEPLTTLAEELIGRLTAEETVSEVMLIGYAQDHTGYIMLEDDWWQGGYEASATMWGPRQGEHLIDSAEEAFTRTVIEGPHLGRAKWEPLPLEPFPVPEYVPYEPDPAEDVGAVVSDATSLVSVEDVVTFTVQGSDSWQGAPIATLLRENGEPVVTQNGAAVTSDGYAFWVGYTPVPSYSEERDADSRAFLWTFSMPVQQTTGGFLPSLSGGTYKLEVVLPTEGDDVVVESSPFTVE